MLTFAITKMRKSRIHIITLMFSCLLITLHHAGALSGSTTVQQKKFVAKSATSVVEGGDAFVGVKQNTRPIIVIDNYDSFTYNLCQVKTIFCCINDGWTFSHIKVASDIIRLVM